MNSSSSIKCKVIIIITLHLREEEYNLVLEGGRIIHQVFQLEQSSPACLKCTPSHLSVDGEEAETLVFGKTIVVIHHQMLEVVANGNLILALP